MAVTKDEADVAVDEAMALLTPKMPECPCVQEVLVDRRQPVCELCVEIFDHFVVTQHGPFPLGSG
jgi:hypothetical protein